MLLLPRGSGLCPLSPQWVPGSMEQKGVTESWVLTALCFLGVPTATAPVLSELWPTVPPYHKGQLLVFVVHFEKCLLLTFG